MVEPLTPPNCNLQDFPRMMIDIPRLRGSEFDSILDDGAWRAGLNLWLTSWHQVPAASLPQDDAALAKAAGLGRDVRTWRKVKAEALRGWQVCSDGLLYHPVVAEMALEAWLEKLSQALSSGAGNAKRWGGVFDPAPIEAEIEQCAGMLAAINPKSKALAKASRRKSRPQDDGNPDGTGKPSRRDAKNIPSGSQGTGKGIEEPPIGPPTGGDLPGFDLEPDDPEPVDEVAAAFEAWNELARRLALPVAKGLDDARRRAIRKRLEEGGLDGWSEALAGVERSAFLRGIRPGGDGRTMKADLGFVCQAKSYPRLREGFYGDDAPPAAERRAAEPWQGPPDVWAAISTFDPKLAAGFLARCRWQDVPRAVVTTSPTVAERLRRDAAHVFDGLNVAIVLDKPGSERSAA